MTMIREDYAKEALRLVREFALSEEGSPRYQEAVDAAWKLLGAVDADKLTLCHYCGNLSHRREMTLVGVGGAGGGEELWWCGCVEGNEG